MLMIEALEPRWLLSLSALSTIWPAGAAVNAPPISRDGQADYVDGGFGTDKVITDRLDTIVNVPCVKGLLFLK